MRVVLRALCRPRSLSACLHSALRSGGRGMATPMSGGRGMATLETLPFDNRALRALPLDREDKNYVRTVQGACYSRVLPSPVENPVLVAHSLPALGLLGLPATEVARPEFVRYFSGSEVLRGSHPAAHCYCGHQFGQFSGQLGDGCAHYLGEVVGESGQRWELQLKGSGKTPYSRHADGRKVLRSSIREFLCSEAMHHLGIPTTRAASCVTSDSKVTRDIHYNGKPILERVTVISRIAPTFLRFGSFEIFKPRDPFTGRAGPSVGRLDILHQLTDHTTQNFFPEIHAAHPEDRVARTAAFFSEVCLRTARLVAQWQCVGFCHGVLNTDNMSIIGQTIDYGPFGFMDRYDPAHICNGSDDGGRYAYSRQPAVCKWNLSKLSEALSSCLPRELAEEGIRQYEAEFQLVYLDRMRRKLGLLRKKLPDDSDLVEGFLETMHGTGCDFTNGFQCLSRLNIPRLASEKEGSDSELEGAAEGFVEQCATPQELVKAFKPRMSSHQLLMFSQLMLQSPDVLRQLGISPETIGSELSKIESIEKLKHTSAEDKREKDRTSWIGWLKTYRARLAEEVEDISDNDAGPQQANSERQAAMQRNNPRIVLRNHIAQKAIELAEQGDYSEVRRVLHLLETPYDMALNTAPTATPTVTMETASDEIVPDNYDASSRSHYFYTSEPVGMQLSSALVGATMKSWLEILPY